MTSNLREGYRIDDGTTASAWTTYSYFSILGRLSWLFINKPFSHFRFKKCVFQGLAGAVVQRGSHPNQQDYQRYNGAVLGGSLRPWGAGKLFVVQRRSPCLRRQLVRGRPARRQSPQQFCWRRQRSEMSTDRSWRKVGGTLVRIQVEIHLQIRSCILLVSYRRTLKLAMFCYFIKTF